MRSLNYPPSAARCVVAEEREALEERIEAARRALVELPLGSIERREATDALHHLERLVMFAESLAPTADPGEARRSRNRKREGRKGQGGGRDR